MHILFVSPECYPAAKVGGLGDVVGALPKYLQKSGHTVSVIMPMYANAWIMARKHEEVFRGGFHMDNEHIDYTIVRLRDVDMGYHLHFVHIPGKFDRPGVYMDPYYGTYGDEDSRSVSFQRAVLDWVRQWSFKPDVIHCHDHHAGLIPFMMQHTAEFGSLSYIPTVFTIHNAAYQGIMSWEHARKLPMFTAQSGGMIEWNGNINRLAAGIRCSWAVTTVSQGYLNSLYQMGFGLEWLFERESGKSIGIINGIDSEVWDPKTDDFIAVQHKRSWKVFKDKNKKVLTDRYNLDHDLPLFVFIGRLAYEKGADLLRPMLYHFFESGHQANFILLGSGDPKVEGDLRIIENERPDHVRALITYDEGLSHELYAGLDFLIMPSRTEPCGLNQMYTMRYAGIPVVMPTGGLLDTVEVINGKKGNGVLFDNYIPEDMSQTLASALRLYEDDEVFQTIRKKNAKKDFSWDRSAATYIKLYESLITQ